MNNFIKSVNFQVYFFFMSIVSIYLATSFLENIPAPTVRDQLHAILIVITYGIIYQFPAAIAYYLLKKWKVIAIIIAVLLSATAHVFIFSDNQLYDLYGFHINGFVWNLVTTKGGIDSLGADQTNYLLVSAYATGLIALHATALFIASVMPRISIRKRTFITIFVVATLTERVIFGYSLAQLYGPVLDRGDAFPFYKQMKMNSFLSKLGVDVKKSKYLRVAGNDSTLDYPKHEIVYSENIQPKNIIILVSESLRWDMMTPKIMPNLYQLSESSWNLSQHYSGGNGTRQGMFSLFYGLYGSYWDAFLRANQGPVLIDAMNKYNYEKFIYTSASFTYPEFNKTIFARVPNELLHEEHHEEPWKCDVSNTTALINGIKQHNKSKPFFGFIFYEETHARYSFDQRHEIDHDYIKSLNYFGLSRKELAPQIDSLKARYINAAHGIDIQIQRIVSTLKETNELDNTIIIVTGDHGEEFMERSRWGHNSDFTDWQVRVPMIIYIPGKQAKIFTQPTSHIDIAPTLLAELGIQNETADHALGIDLSKPIRKRSIVVASWTDIGIINEYGKLVIPFKTTTQHKNLALDTADNPISADTLIKQMRLTIPSVLADIRRYYH